VTEGDGKRIARQWSREVEDALRRANHPKENGRGRIVVWTVLWLIWLVALAFLGGWVAGFYR